MQAFVEVMSDGSEHVLYNRPGFAVFTRRERMSAFSKGRVLCHWHEDLEFLAVRQGRMRYSVNGEFFEIGEGEGLFINSCHMHSFECLRGADCAFSSLLVHPSVLGANAYLRENFVRPLSRNVECRHGLAGDDSARRMRGLRDHGGRRPRGRAFRDEPGL